MKLGIFPSPRACLGGSSELFQFPRPLYREEGLSQQLFLDSRAFMGRARNYSKFQGPYIGRKKCIWRLAPRFACLISRAPYYFFIFSTYFFIIFLQIFYLFRHSLIFFLFSTYFSILSSYFFTNSHQRGEGDVGGGEELCSRMIWERGVVILVEEISTTCVTFVEGRGRHRSNFFNPEKFREDHTKNATNFCSFEWGFETATTVVVFWKFRFIT